MSKEHVYAYEAGYQDGLRAATDELNAENAKLREQMRHLQKGYGSMSREHSQTIVELSDAYGKIDRLKDENAKLRELVRDMWGSGYPDRSCEGCDIYDECYDTPERVKKDGRENWSRCLFELRIEDRMRELGVVK